MDGIVTTAIFPGYESTLNPWLFLRNLFGLMVLAGLALAAWRRYSARSRQKTSAMDVAALILVGAIVGSGFLVEGAKIASRLDFFIMVEDYHGLEESEEVAALEALWVTEYGVAAARPGVTYTAEQIALGREINRMSCIECHAKPQWAPASYALSRLLTPLSRNQDSDALVTFAYWLHVIFCFGTLAWLPFSKMRHVVTSPLSCIADRCRRSPPDAAPPLRAVNRMLALDACTRCGLCSENCSVGICADLLRNPYILPSEKLAALNGGASRSNVDAGDLLEGLTFADYIVTIMGARIDALWLVPHFFLTVMILTCTGEAVGEDQEGEERRARVQSLISGRIPEKTPSAPA